jgi:hypothetical protein
MLQNSYFLEKKIKKIIWGKFLTFLFLAIVGS